MADELDRWVLIQQNTFTNWVNENLRTLDLRVDSLGRDLADGVRLCALMEVLCKRGVGKVIKRPMNHHHSLENVTQALRAMTADGIKLVNIGPEDICNNNIKLILGMIWQLIRHYQIGTTGDARVPPKKLMLAWVRAVIPDCNVTNFNKDWNDGIALHGIIEYCRPGTCPNWRNLRHKESGTQASRFQNAESAIRLAHEHLGIPMVLTPENLSSHDLDELSGMTYLSYFMKEESPGYYATLNWVRQQISPRPVNNFDKDWNDGTILWSLVTSCGSTYDFSQHEADTSDWERNIQIGMDEAVNIGVEPVISAKEMADLNVDHIGIMAYAATFQALDPPTPAPTPAPPSPAPYVPEVAPPVPKKRPSIDVVIPETCKAGGIASFTVRGQTNGSLIRAEALSPSGRTEYMSINSEQNDCLTTAFTPTEVGDWSISIFYDNEETVESPFHMDVYDASQVFILGLESGLVLQPVRFTVDCSRAGNSSLDVNVTNSQDFVKNNIDERGQGLYDVTFMPTIPDNYNVNVYFGGDQVAGSPFYVNILDMENVYATGSGLSEVSAGKEATFTVNACSAPGRDIVVQIVAPALVNVPFELVDNQDSTYTIKYTPTEPGEHVIEVLYGRDQINGSPYRVQVREPQVKVTNYTPEIYTGEMATLNVDGSEVGKGSIEIEINEGLVKVGAVHQNPNNKRVYDVIFTPDRQGEYYVNIKYKDQLVAGSPWLVNVKDYTPDGAPGYTTAPRIVNTINV